MKRTLLFALCGSVFILAGCVKTGSTAITAAPADKTTTAPTDKTTTAPADGKDYTAFATCLTNMKLKMYGTEWCGHCKAQKEMFGDAFKNVTYTDCDKERQACIDAGVQGFPTWIDAAGNKYPGTQTLEKLAEVAGCSMDGTASKPAPTAEVAPAVETGSADADTGTEAPVAETGSATTGA